MVIFPQNDNVQKYLARLPFIFFVIQSFLGNCIYLFPLETFQRTFRFGNFSEVITFANWQSYSLFQFPRYVQYTKALETFHIESRSHVPQFQPVQCSGRSLLKIPQCQNVKTWTFSTFKFLKQNFKFFDISGEDCGSGQAVVTRTPLLHRRPDQRSQLQDEGDDCLPLWAGSFYITRPHNLDMVWNSSFDIEALSKNISDHALCWDCWQENPIHKSKLQLQGPHTGKNRYTAND